MTDLRFNFQEDDIDRKFARRAFYHTSHSPERRGDSYIDQYMTDMKNLVDTITPYITPENKSGIEADFEYYRQGYLKRLNEYLAAHSRVASAFIVGPAKFPTARNRKHSDAADRRRDEWLAWQEKGKEKLLKKYDPQVRANAPIRSDDEDALERLQAKIKKLEDLQETMKAANKIIRKKGLSEEEKIQALAKQGFHEMKARDLFAPDYMGWLGFPPYRLQNNNANIRRLKARLATLQKEKERPTAEDKQITIGGQPCTLTEERVIGRLQLVFDDKPPSEVRTTLKRNGFRWAPSQGAWQRVLNDNARRAVNIIKD